jgi:hypothetical protein
MLIFERCEQLLGVARITPFALQLADPLLLHRDVLQRLLDMLLSAAQIVSGPGRHRGRFLQQTPPLTIHFAEGSRAMAETFVCRNHAFLR